MKRIFSLHVPDWFLLAIALSLGLLGCRKDYYSLITQEGACLPGQRELTKECRDAILKYAPIDVASFQKQGHQDLLDDLVDALHVFLAAPLKFPTQGKMFGLTTLEEAGMYDFIDTFLSDPDANLNEKFTNFILNSASNIRYGCASIAEAGKANYYAADTIYLCSTGMLSIPGVLIHEARHAKAGWHDTHCSPNNDTFYYECDKNFDHVHGWEIAFLWGIVHGTGDTAPDENHFFEATELEDFANEMGRCLEYIKLPPAKMLPPGQVFDVPPYIGELSERELLNFPPRIEPLRLQKQVEVPLEESLLAINSGDFNHDGKQDLVLAFPGKLQVWLNQGLGIFTKAPAFDQFNPCQEHFKLIPADFNQDQQLDIAVSCTTFSQYNTLFWLPGQGDGTFGTMLAIEADPEGILFDVADVNHDQMPDIVVHLAADQDTLILLNQEGGDFDFCPHSWRGAVTWLRIADVNNDQIPDMILMTQGWLDVFIGAEGGSFAAMPISSKVLNLGNPPDFLSEFSLPPLLGDLNQDGYLDLIFSNQFNFNEIVLGQKDGTFSDEDINLLSLSPNASVAYQILADLNEDGNLDVVEIDHQGRVQISLARGFLTYRSDSLDDIFSVPIKNESSLILVEDFNGDGRPDLVFASGTKDLTTPQPDHFSMFFNQSP